MKKKITLAILITLLAAVSLTGIATAQTDSPPDGERQGTVGQITALGTSSFSMTTVRGEDITVQVTDETIYKNRDGSDASFSDLTVGRWVAGRGFHDDEGSPTAKVVVLLPEDFDPTEFQLVKMGGEVDKINNGQNTFTIITKDGESVTLNVDDNTRWGGDLTNLDDLEKGMRVGIGAFEQEDGSLLAKLVANRNPDDQKGKRTVGQITSIGTSSFTIQPVRGDEVTVQVTEETIYRNSDGSDASFGALIVDRWVAGVGAPDDDGSPTARLVILLPEDFDPSDFKLVRIGGEVDKINKGQSTFTIITKDGESVTISVDDRTRWGGTLTSLDDLEKGMLVGVGAVEQEDGSLLAKLVANGNPDDQRGKRTVGQITSIGASSFTIQPVRGDEVTVQVTEETIYRNSDGSDASFGALIVDRWVAGVGAPDDDGSPTARLVILLPEDFDPSDFKLVRIGGEVDKINKGQSTFTIITKDGESVTISVDDRTRWGGTLTSLDDLEKGMLVGVGALEQEDGSLLAKLVANGSRDSEPDRNNDPDRDRPDPNRRS